MPVGGRRFRQVSRRFQVLGLVDQDGYVGLDPRSGRSSQGLETRRNWRVAGSMVYTE